MVAAVNHSAPAEKATAGAAKNRIVGELGEKELVLPTAVNEALAANDRAKYLLTLLQAARDRADHPDAEPADLKQERLACGIAEPFDDVINSSQKIRAGIYRIQGAQHVHELLVENIRQMLLPFQSLSAGTLPEAGESSAEFEGRLQKLLAQSPPRTPEDEVPGAYIDRISSGQRNGHDSLHLLIMDLHKRLNQLQQQIATETIDGACAYGIQEGDRPLVRAFMAGVNQTRALKFDHPGLGTTATRAGEELVIQNDLGTTDAHVLVVHVRRAAGAPATAAQVTLTHTDVHLQRLLFFQGLFNRFAVDWDDTRSRRTGADQVYHLCHGTYAAPDQGSLEEFLRFLGSRLVFLIDWNRARKSLRKLAGKRICLEVLRWAADQNVGQRGFLELGGERLIFEALQTWGKVPLQSGAQLADILGDERLAEFLKFTLRTAAEGLLAGRSELLIRDEISAELRQYIETAHQGLLEIAAEHASLIVELAMAARDSLLMTVPAGDRDYLQRTALRAKAWEHRADELVKKTRAAHERWQTAADVPELLGIADDAADALEEAVFFLTLLPTGNTPSFLPLHDLAGLLVRGAQEHLKVVENARCTQRSSPREQVQDFLEAVAGTVTIEHEADEAHRHAQASILSFAGDFKQLHLFAKIADNLEEAADALQHSALVLRDYVLKEVLTR